MTKLLIASILAVGISFPAASQAEISAFGVSLPIENTEVSDNLRGGYVATSASDSLTVQKLSSDGQSKSGQAANDSDSFVLQKLSDSSPQS